MVDLQISASGTNLSADWTYNIGVVLVVQIIIQTLIYGQMEILLKQ